MFAFMCKRRFLHTACLVNVKPQLGSLDISRSISSSPKEDKTLKQHSFTVSYLINNCGLSLEVSISKSQKVKFESSDRPDTILALLRDHGFENGHISKLISKIPALLLAHPENTLSPKLKFFGSIGASSDDLASCPALLNYSLHNRIVPCYHFLKSMILSDKQIVAVLKRFARMFVYYVQDNLGPNVALLKQIGVPQTIISSMICRESCVMILNSDSFKKYVQAVLELEFDPSKMLFVQALSVISGMSTMTWEHKKEVYKRWGWSDHEVSMAFKKNPICMSISEKKIMSGMDILVNKMGLQSMDISRTPVVLCYSLEKRIIPRWSVIRVLKLKGLIKEDLTLNTYMHLSEKHFLERFVTKYQEQFPQLLTVYQGKVGLQELGIGPGNMLVLAKP